MRVNDIEIEVIRSDRKTIAIEINIDLRVLVRSPQFLSDNDIQSFVIKKSNWLKQHLQLMKERNEKKALPPKLSRGEIEVLGKQALDIIPKRVQLFAPIIGVGYGKLTVRNQKTLWGSCSSGGNLSFNCLLMLAPPEVVDYVVVHELCHRRHMNHSKSFWGEVERVLPNYRVQKKWLKDNGNELLARI